MRFSVVSRVSELALFLGMSTTVFAHAEHGAAAGFLTGLAHPVGGLDHVLAMVAVGLWGAVLGNPAVWLLPIAFPILMAFGGLMGLMGWPLPAVEAGIALSSVVLGAMVLFRARPPIAVAMLMVGAFALFHGHAHGTELPVGGNPMLYSMGFVVGTGLLHTMGIAIGALNRFRLGDYAVRGAASGVVAGGLIFLWQALAA